MMRFLKKRFGRVPGRAIRIEQLPKNLETKSAGELTLDWGYLIQGADGPRYIKDHLPNSHQKVLLEFFSYQLPGSHDWSKPTVSLHPPSHGTIEVDAWRNYFDDRYPHLARSWSSTVSSGIQKLKHLFADYGEKQCSGDEIMKMLKPVRFKIIVDGDDEISFEKIEIVPSFDLLACVSESDQVTGVSFDG